MTDSRDDELDRRLRALMGAAGDEGPTVTSSLPTSTVRRPASRPLDRRWWLVIAVFSALVVGAAAFAVADHQSRHTATPVTDFTPPTVTATPSSVPSTTTPVTTPADPITRPYLDPTICMARSATEYVSHGITYRPFALDYHGTMPLQVLAASTDGVAKPFAVVLRVPATNRSIVNSHQVTINGTTVSIAITASGNSQGNGQALWTLPDGSKGYLRSRDLDEAALEVLIGRLTPRDLSAPIPGFDLAPTTDPDGLVLLHEHLNTDLSGTVEMFECGNSNGGYRVRAISGDPVFVYFGIVDVRRPYAAGVNGSGVITIEGTDGPSAPTVRQVTNADESTWARLLHNQTTLDTTVAVGRTCTGADLRAMADTTTGVAMSNVKYVIRLTNISDTACDMPTGPLTLAAIDASNTTVPLTIGQGTYFGDPPPLTGPLPPQGTVVVWLGGAEPTMCAPAPITWPAFQLELPDHTTVRFTSTLDTGCAIGISAVGSPA